MIRCFILDDEQHAIDALKTCIDQTPFLTLAGTATNGYEVLDLLPQHTFDLLFMDIQMPKISGIEMLGLVDTPVILTTAYSEYAVDGFNHDVVDYLLKPFTHSRFLKAAQKASILIKSKNKLSADRVVHPVSAKDYIFIKGEHKGKQFKINHYDIDYIESVKNYAVFHCGSTMHIASMSLKEIEARLPGNEFVRIHNSCIVALSRVLAVEGNAVLVSVPQGKIERLIIGITYKARFMEFINS
jgi:two-component system LytT family response regulator